MHNMMMFTGHSLKEQAFLKLLSHLEFGELDLTRQWGKTLF